MEVKKKKHRKDNLVQTHTGEWEGWNTEPTALTRSRENSPYVDLAKREHFSFHQYKKPAKTT